MVKAMRKMKRGNAAGPCEITTEMVKALDEKGMNWMWALLKKDLKTWEEERIQECAYTYIRVNKRVTSSSVETLVGST